MRITERDIEILKFINNVGFCQIAHIERRFRLNFPRHYKLMKRLVQKELVKHERIFHSKQGIYRCTRKGADFTPLPPLYKVSLATCTHSLTVIDVYLKLMTLFPDAIWISERALLHKKYAEGVGQSGHVCDGLLVLANQKHIAIEVELTHKSNHRLETIFNTHCANFDIQEVWYFCTDSIADRLKKRVNRDGMIKIFTIDGLFNDKENPALS